MKQTGPDILFSVDINGGVEDAVARGYQDVQKRPFYRVSVSNGLDIDIYWWTPEKNGETLWFEKAKQQRTPTAQMIGDALLAHLKSQA